MQHKMLHSKCWDRIDKDASPVQPLTNEVSATVAQSIHTLVTPQFVLGRRQTQPRACPPGFKSRSRRAPPLVFYTICSVGCVWGFWWFPPFELHVYSSMWTEALTEYGVVPELFLCLFLYLFIHH
jgi:hypothetical protein